MKRSSLMVIGLVVLSALGLTGCVVGVAAVVPVHHGVVYVAPAPVVVAPAPVVVAGPPVVVEEGACVEGAVVVAPSVVTEWVFFGGGWYYYHPHYHYWVHSHYPAYWHPVHGHVVTIHSWAERPHHEEWHRGPRYH